MLDSARLHQPSRRTRGARVTETGPLRREQGDDGVWVLKSVG
jgi:hypothetical protein